MDLREQNFGVEVEMTGLTRSAASQVAAEYFHHQASHVGGVYDAYAVKDNEGREWKFVSDGSLNCQKKEAGRLVSASRLYSVEMVTPICTYRDIETIQELLRKLRQNGAFVNGSCGVHIHVNAAPFTAPKLRNLVNIVASKEDMIYKALQVSQSREVNYCKRIEPSFLEEINRKKPKTMEELKSIWYHGADGSHEHYHSSRYHCLNLHSVFQKGTIEFRAFNGEIHAGKIKAYIQFCLAITAQAYNQQYAKPDRTITTNDKYSFRVWLLRLGLIGDEFKTARLHLLNHLEGNIAWRDPAQAQRQQERLRQQQEEARHIEEQRQQEQQARTRQEHSQEIQGFSGLSMI